MSKIDVIISTLDQLTAGELKALRGEINARLDDNPYNNGYTDGFNDANEKHQKDSMRHRQPVILEAQELSINLAVIATAAAVMGQGKDKVSDAIKDARNQSVSLIDSLTMRINRAKNEGITFTLHADAWIKGLLKEAKEFYEQPTNNGDRLRAYVGSLDLSLSRIIEMRTDKSRDEIIDRLCTQLHEYISNGKSLPQALKQVEKNLKLMSHSKQLNEETRAEYNLLVLGEWGEKNARTAYNSRYGSIRSLKNAR